MIYPMPSQDAYRLNRFQVALKALSQLGPGTLGQYALYQLGLRSGYYRLRSGSRLVKSIQHPLQELPQSTLSSNLFPQPSLKGLPTDPEVPVQETDLGDVQATDLGDFQNAGLFPLPSPQELSAFLGETGRTALLSEAEEILQGKVRLFGGPPVPLELVPPPPLSHWTFHARRLGDGQDIKFTWEPARFCWAAVLARAYRLSGDERYSQAFWQHTESFLSANPPYHGPNWTSAQEVALRLLSLVFACQVFAPSPHTTEARRALLVETVALHAGRIPLTLSYARAQNNNHLLSESAGLLTAGLTLPFHPHASHWTCLGWRWFNRALLSQFDQDGAYIQHSASYHRLALQLALWIRLLLVNYRKTGIAPPAEIPSPLTHTFPVRVLERLAAAARWMLDLHDPSSGRLPNLGPNDGALILPLSTCPIDDYRPVLQSASAAFLNQLPFPTGSWDENLVWLGLSREQVHSSPADVPLLVPGVGRPSPHPSKRPPFPVPPLPPRTPHILRATGGSTWAYLRLARFTSRPGHSDQLHLDLWWRGINLALDPGTYLYNGAPPWDNPLAESEYHNTLTVDNLGQMPRPGRFLFLDWAQARMLSQDDCSITAEHDGYRRLGLLHRRRLSVTGSNLWRIDDSLLPAPAARPASHNACLHWLLPDFQWSMESDLSPEEKTGAASLRLSTPFGQVHIQVSGGQSLQLVRCGQLLRGSGPVKETWGWSSPTYGLKIPALCLRVAHSGVPPMSFTTLITLPG